jgi:hypothetical protein
LRSAAIVSTEGRKFRDWRESFIIVDAFDLGESLGDYACFVFLDGAIWAVFYPEDPFAADNLMVVWARHDFVDAQVLKRALLVVAGEFPFSGVGACPGFCV